MIVDDRRLGVYREDRMVAAVEVVEDKSTGSWTRLRLRCLRLIQSDPRFKDPESGEEWKAEGTKGEGSAYVPWSLDEDGPNVERELEPEIIAAQDDIQLGTELEAAAEQKQPGPEKDDLPRGEWLVGRLFTLSAEGEISGYGEAVRFCLTPSGLLYLASTSGTTRKMDEARVTEVRKMPDREAAYQLELLTRTVCIANVGPERATR